jgi:methylglutaconyl-CoA hydratase
VLAAVGSAVYCNSIRNTEYGGAPAGARDILGISSETRGGICRIAIGVPTTDDAEDGDWAQDLIDRLSSAAADPAVRAVVLTGSGRHFSPVPDVLGDARPGGDDGATTGGEDGTAARLLKTFDELPKPTVVRVEGVAAGLAVGLVACADVAIAADDAEFAVTDVRHGRVPDAVTPFLVRAIGPHQARRWLLTGDRFKASEARMAGLVHDVAPRGMLDASIDRTVISLAKGAIEAIAATKALIAAR